MCINFYCATTIIGSFITAMENMKVNHIPCIHLSASAFVKPEYLQEAPVNFIPEEPRPFQRHIQFCVDEDKFDTIPVVDVHNAPEITSFCGKLFLNDPDHIKKTVVKCFNQRVRKGQNPDFEKAVMNVCFSLLEMPQWWFFITTYLQINYSSPDDFILYTYQCCENYRTLSLINQMFTDILIRNTPHGMYNMVDNLAFNDLTNTYYDYRLECERERKIVVIEGIKFYNTVDYWYDTTNSIDYILYTLGSVNNE